MTAELIVVLRESSRLQLKMQTDQLVLKSGLSMTNLEENFPKAISLCHGDIIFLADQDDVWNPRKIEMMMPVFEDESVILAFHDAELVDERLNQVYPSFWETMNFDYNLLL